MGGIVQAISLYCRDQCPPGRRCLNCVFVEYVPRVADHLGTRNANVVSIEEYRREKEAQRGR
jgi:hypothetical protein